MTTYMITDQDGYAITEGLQGPEVSDEAYDLAQEIANERGEEVYLSRADGRGRDIVFRPECAQ